MARPPFWRRTRRTPPSTEQSCPYTSCPWRDTQIWELRPASGPADDPSVLRLPFEARLANPSQPGGPDADGALYQVSRAFFFEPEDPQPPHGPRRADPLWGLATENASPGGLPPVFGYPHLYRHNPAQGRRVSRPREGTYERWYVANIGSGLSNLGAGPLPDMHPFHMHVVNFVVTRRWRLDRETNTFEDRTGGRPFDFDQVARHDTVRVPANELLELLVHFPRGYTGRYPYHCHLVEHEDMGMMLHVEVQPRSGA